MHKNLLGILPLMLLHVGCNSNSSIRAHSYWGTTIERPAFGSIYDWSAESGHLEPGQDPIVARAIQEDVEMEMAAMGFIKRNGTEKPDYLISSHIGRGLQPSPSGPEQRANLAVRLISAVDGRIVYCASADALIDPTLTPEERRSKLDIAVHEILRPLTPCPHQHSGTSRH